mmetsp:Transcript_4901/g.7910  ORF Transcript_4901/g.7910 Transcript_4901/m.7910 type:complete len:359 (+) Transcript_4901:3-1079(+)
MIKKSILKTSVCCSSSSSSRRIVFNSSRNLRRHFSSSKDNDNDNIVEKSNDTVKDVETRKPKKQKFVNTPLPETKQIDLKKALDFFATKPSEEIPNKYVSNAEFLHDLEGPDAAFHTPENAAIFETDVNENAPTDYIDKAKKARDIAKERHSWFDEYIQGHFAAESLTDHEQESGSNVPPSWEGKEVAYQHFLKDNAPLDPMEPPVTAEEARVITADARREEYANVVTKCLFCSKPDQLDNLHAVNTPLLLTFMNAFGYIQPRAMTKLCAKHQRRVNATIRRSRHFGLISYKKSHNQIYSPFKDTDIRRAPHGDWKAWRSRGNTTVIPKETDDDDTSAALPNVTVDGSVVSDTPQLPK